MPTSASVQPIGMRSTRSTSSWAWCTARGCRSRLLGSTPLPLTRGRRCWRWAAARGSATLELARRGYAVLSTDSSADMVALASQRIAEAGLDVAVSVSDVHDLPYAAGSFELVLALGVLPWLHSPRRALGEMARVLAPGGHAILSADNRLRLNGLVEPAENPIFVPAKYARRAARALCGRPRPGAIVRLYTPGRVDRWLVAAGLEPERRTTVGSGRSLSSGGPFFLTAPHCAFTAASITSPSAGSPVCAATGGTTSSRLVGPDTTYE